MAHDERAAQALVGDMQVAILALAAMDRSNNRRVLVINRKVVSQLAELTTALRPDVNFTQAYHAAYAAFETLHERPEV